MAFSKYEEKDCPRCGRPVICTGNMNCWCLSLEIPETVQDYIAATFDGCLCKTCILELIDQLQNTDL
jgi:hypothetical protein